ncbi:MAG: VTT domain-containing protein [Bacilli bacterium]|nr:VTT domain-containing protein [Bacilli bacterium]
MMEILKEIDIFITGLLNNIGLFGPILAGVLIVVESIIPILPLSVFITLNFYYFGSLMGFIISWLLTSLGCYLSFYIFRKKMKLKFDTKFIINKQNKISKWMIIINRLKLEQLVLVMAIPFTPAFMVNIVAGLSSMKTKKYILAILISKIFLVYFWGFIGITLLESFTNPIKIVQVILISSLGFIISKIVNKRYNIE